MKFIKSHWQKLVSMILMSMLILYVLCIGIMKIRNIEIYHKDTSQIKIYEIWHIETFEGGGKSRISYINNITRTIEKQNPEIIFMTKSIDPNLLADHLSQSKPDIISFGYGIGDDVLPYLLPLNKTYDVRDELVDSGTFDRRLYALPYIMSGYALFRHSLDSTSFHCGQNNFISPNIIYDTLSYQPIEVESQYDAYKDFVYDKNTILLGSGRDLFRINNLNILGRANATIEPINSYTDLIQYIGITRQDEIIEKFLIELFSIQNQNSLADYSLFPALDIKLYHNGIYNDMENSIKECHVAKVF